MNLSHHTDFRKLNLAQLTDYIQQRHHNYIRKVKPLIIEKLARSILQIDKNQAVLQEILSLFSLICDLSEKHMRKEETVIFPYARKLMQFAKGEDKEGFPEISLLKNTLEGFKDEHKQFALLMSEVRNLSNNYTPTQESYSSLGSLYAELMHFELDLHNHIFLENNLLFPKMLELEKKLLLARPVK